MRKPRSFADQRTPVNRQDDSHFADQLLLPGAAAGLGREGRESRTGGYRRPRADSVSTAKSAFEIPVDGNRSRAYLAAKRALDIVVAGTSLVLLSPLLILTLLALSVTTRGRPIFCQERVGQCGRRFRMYKFRTMVLDAARLQHLVDNQQDGPIFKNRRDPRITRVGAFLRSTSIDELPQLVNVLLGQMSLVGPRPPVPNEVAQYEPWQRRRLSVKPGLTCLWQVSGRSQIGFEEWMQLDVWYVEHQSFRTDLALLLRTPWAVLSRRGAY